jgi:hypothetical protein
MSPGRRQQDRSAAATSFKTLIARLMTVVIVVRFEGINIAQHKRQTPFVATRGPYLGGKIGIEETPVGKTCKSVVQGQLFEGAVRNTQFCGQLSKPGVVHSGFNQQHDEQRARRQQSIHPAPVPADVEATGIKAGRQRDVEEPCAHDDQQPQIEHILRRPTPQNDQRQEAQQPERPDDQVQRRGKAAVQHEHREQLLAQSGHHRKRRHDSKNGHNACQNGEARPAAGQPDCPALIPMPSLPRSLSSA